MEGLSGPSELELNKERIIALKQMCHNLTYELKKKKQVHSSNSFKMHQHIKQQWNKIEELKKEKDELVLQLRLCDTQRFSKPGSKNLERFLKSLDDMIKLEQQVKRQTDELNKYSSQIKEIEKKVSHRRKRRIKTYTSKDVVLHMLKDESLVQDRLNRMLTKYSEQLKANHDLREDIKSILQTESAFRKQYAELRHLISRGKKNIQDLVNGATMSYQTSKSAKAKLNMLKERTQLDQKKLEEKIKDLQLLLEQDKQMKALIELEIKNRGIMSEREMMESKKYQALEEKLHEYQKLLASLQQAVDCKDVDKICKAYIQLQGLKGNLIRKINDLNVEVEKLQEEAAAEKGKLNGTQELFKELNRRDVADKSDIEDLTRAYMLKAQELENSADAKSDELESVKRKLQSIYQCLDFISSQETTLSVDESITDDNIVFYLEILEKRLIELFSYLRILDKKQDYNYYEE